MNLLQYRQCIDTECGNTTGRILSVKAIKLDGTDSLKDALGLANIKTCDYLRHRAGKALIIECSDLLRQCSGETSDYQNLIDLVGNVTDHKLKKSLRRQIKQLDPETRIREELRYKCIHTLLLLHRLGNRAGFKVEEKFNQGVVLLVAICTQSPADVLAFQHLEVKLQAALKGIAGKVKVVPAGQLDKFLSKVA